MNGQVRLRSLHDRRRLGRGRGRRAAPARTAPGRDLRGQPRRRHLRHARLRAEEAPGLWRAVRRRSSPTPRAMAGTWCRRRTIGARSSPRRTASSTGSKASITSSCPTRREARRGRGRIVDPHTVEVDGKSLYRRAHHGRHRRPSGDAGDPRHRARHHLERGARAAAPAAPRRRRRRRLYRASSSPASSPRLGVRSDDGHPRRGAAARLRRRRARDAWRRSCVSAASPSARAPSSRASSSADRAFIAYTTAGDEIAADRRALRHRPQAQHARPRARAKSASRSTSVARCRSTNGQRTVRAAHLCASAT